MYKIYPKTLFVGQIIQYLPSCQSTNDEASALIAQKDPAEGTVVVTDHQTAGRGQRGNQWEALAGQNLTLSLILRPTFLAATEQFWLNIAISLGLYDGLQPLLGEALRIKWPNDIYVGDQKLGGILIENTIQGYAIAWSVIGMGININQTEFSYATATSLQLQQPLPTTYHLPQLTSILCEAIEKRYLQLRSGQRDSLRDQYLRILYQYKQVHWFEAGGTTFRGTIVGIDTAGRLAIATNEQTHYFNFKEVRFVSGE